MSDDATPAGNRVQAEPSRTRRPWFLAGTDQSGESSTPVGEPAIEASANGRTPGLLDRAFNGPQSRAVAVDLVSDELEERRSARRAETDQAASPPAAPAVVDYQTSELPFPPSDPDVTVLGS